LASLKSPRPKEHEILKLIPLAVAIAAALALAGFAQADTPGCVTKSEYRHVHKGDSIRRVHRIFDTRGRLQEKGTSGGYPAKLRIYKACGSPSSTVAVQYHKKPSGVWRLAAKSAVWV
jgi:hypothetical protein